MNRTGKRTPGMFAGVGAAIIGAVMTYFLSTLDPNIIPAQTGTVRTGDITTQEGTVTVIGSMPHATVIIGERKFALQPENVSKKGEPTVGDVIDYNLGLSDLRE